MLKEKKVIFVFLFILVLLSFKPTWLFNNPDLGSPGNDDLSYWLHAATIAYDFDINYLNDYSIGEGKFNYETNVPYHPPGAGYLSSIFVFIFSLFDQIEYERLNPIGSFAYLGYFFSTLFYFCFGIYLLSKVLQKNYPKSNRNSELILFSAFCGTLVHYVVTRFMMSHAIEFFLCSLLCYLLERSKGYFDQRTLLYLFTTYYFLSFTRPSTFIYSLCLFLIYLNKDSLNRKIILNIMINSTVFALLHVLLSNYLYGTNTIFENYQTNFQEQNYQFDLLVVIENIKFLPNLIFSTSMGMIWTLPIVVFGLFSLFNNDFYKGRNKLSKLFTFLYFLGAVIVLMVWEGRDVAFGQRLLIGLIPFCVLRVNNLLINKTGKRIFTYFVSISYIGYFYFYSSSNLTLRPGKTLWGTNVGFTGENYFLYLLKELLNIETLFSAFSRNIFSVNFLKFFPEDNLVRIFNSMFPNNEKISRLLELSEIYSNTELSYLLIGTLILLTFTYVFTRIITVQN